ncbi:MAG: sulfatase, partial [Lachnospiraceae bacterium]|nr:sulfatase [Lachnospiraceae bacterium]
GSLMTGKYPLSIGLWTNCKIGLEEVIMLKPQETCIGNVLKDHGYRTGYIGKWHLDASEQNFTSHPESGARDWDAYTPPGERRQGFDYWLSYGACDEHLDPHYWEDTPKQIRPGKWSAEYETDKAIQFIKASQGKDEPFALFLSYNPPHLPYELVPDRYYQKFRNLPIPWRDNVPEEKRTPEMEVIARQYFAAVHGIDEQFGRVMEALKEAGLEEQTLVALSSDHGEMMGSHGLMSKNIWYEEAVHIPLILRQKGRIQPGTCPVLAASPDHMPTLLQLLELPVPDTCEGYGHGASILNGQDPDAPEWMFLCSYPGGADMVGEFARRGMTHKAYGWRGILTERYTYVACNGYAPDAAPSELLYDRKQDPFQMNPRIIQEDETDEMVAVMRQRLEAYLEKLKDPFLCRWKKEKV